MPSKTSLGQTKDKLEKLLTQAKESVRALETLQKEGMSRARSYIHIPTKEERKRFTDEKIVSSLRKMGLATKEDVRELNDRIEDLASELRAQISKLNRKETAAHKGSTKAKETTV